MKDGFHQVTRVILAEIEALLELVNADEVSNLANAIQKAERIFVTGEGRSGFFVRAFAMRLAQEGFNIFVVGETITPPTRTGDLMIAISGSGETATTLANAESALSSGCELWAITAVRSSSLARAAKGTLQIPGKTKEHAPGQQESIQPLSSLFAQALLITLDTVILLLMQARGQKEEELLQNHANL